MRWIYLSPHFDDIALSVGGRVWEQVQAGQAVEIWTVCAGSPAPGAQLSTLAQELHERWQTGLQVIAARRAEDEAAGQHLGARLRYWDLPDCIYRALPDGNWLVNKNDDLWLPLPVEEGVNVERLCHWLLENLQAQDHLVAPMTAGNHIDHQLVRLAAERAAAHCGCTLWYYPDYPYVATHSAELQAKLSASWQKTCWPVSAAALDAWQEAIACYDSQISTFWKGVDQMRAAMRDYWRVGGGACLWRANAFIKKQ